MVTQSDTELLDATLRLIIGFFGVCSFPVGCAAGIPEGVGITPVDWSSFCFSRRRWWRISSAPRTVLPIIDSPFGRISRIVGVGVVDSLAVVDMGVMRSRIQLCILWVVRISGHSCHMEVEDGKNIGPLAFLQIRCLPQVVDNYM